MNMTAFSTVAALFYLSTTAYQARCLWARCQPYRTILYGFVLMAFLIHSIVLYRLIDTPMGHDLSFWNMASFFTWLMVLLVVLGTLAKPTENLWLLCLPIAALFLLLPCLFPATHQVHLFLSLGELFHIFSSMIAFSVLGIAALQALLVYCQHRNLRSINASYFSLLPPLEAMESFLFSLVVIGFVFLTFSLLGALFLISNVDFWTQSSKGLLSVFAWGFFAVLLVGHYHRGWRGLMAIRWTLLGTCMLLLAYFGNKALH